MNRLTSLPKGYCEIGFHNRVVTVDEAVKLAIKASLSKAAQNATGSC